MDDEQHHQQHDDMEDNLLLLSQRVPSTSDNEEEQEHGEDDLEEGDSGRAAAAAGCGGVGGVDTGATTSSIIGTRRKRRDSTRTPPLGDIAEEDDEEYEDLDAVAATTTPSSSSSPSKKKPRKKFKTTTTTTTTKPYEFIPMKTRNGRTVDNVHRHIWLCPVTRAILSTPQFQRLRGIRQLGTSEHAYINATHNRFEHSIGVAYLAEQMALGLAERQPMLGITPKDVLCVKLAGLCHDMGHGPYSHIFEGRFQEELIRRGIVVCGGDDDDDDDEGGGSGGFRPWKHEEGSLMMFDAALAHLGLKIVDDYPEDDAAAVSSVLDAPLVQIGDRGHRAEEFGVRRRGGFDGDGKEVDYLTSRDMIFVKECILGRPLPRSSPQHGTSSSSSCSSYIGRPWEKEFLYDIVNNRHSGLDVDKMDYFARDQKNAQGKGEVEFSLLADAVVARAHCPDPTNCFQCSSVSNSSKSSRRGEKRNGTNVNGNDHEHRNIHLMICQPKKHIETCMAFFNQRLVLHTQIYTHKATTQAELLICDILLAAAPYLQIPCSSTSSSSSPSSSSSSSSGKKRDTRLLHEAVFEPDFFVTLRDSIIDVIANTNDERLTEAHSLIRRLECRDFYDLVCNERLCKSSDDEGSYGIWDMSANDIREEMLDIVAQERERRCYRASSAVGSSSSSSLEIMEYDEEEDDVIVGNDKAEADDNTTTTYVGIVEEEDFVIDLRTLHYGKKERNPMDYMKFVDKEIITDETPHEGMNVMANQLPLATVADKRSYETKTPITFLEKSIRVFCRCGGNSHGHDDNNKMMKKKAISKCFHMWLERKRGNDRRNGPTNTQS